MRKYTMATLAALSALTMIAACEGPCGRCREQRVVTHDAPPRVEECTIHIVDNPPAQILARQIDECNEHAEAHGATSHITYVHENRR